MCRLTEELDSQQIAATPHTHRLTAVLSALDELQERREVSDSARGRLRGILTTPSEGFSEAHGAVPGSAVRSSGLIRQSSRLSGVQLSRLSGVQPSELSGVPLSRLSGVQLSRLSGVQIVMHSVNSSWQSQLLCQSPSLLICDHHRSSVIIILITTPPPPIIFISSISIASDISTCQCGCLKVVQSNKLTALNT